MCSSRCGSIRQGRHPIRFFTSALCWRLPERAWSCISSRNDYRAHTFLVTSNPSSNRRTQATSAPQCKNTSPPLEVNEGVADYEDHQFQGCNQCRDVVALLLYRSSCSVRKRLATMAGPES